MLDASEFLRRVQVGKIETTKQIPEMIHFKQPLFLTRTPKDIANIFAKFYGIGVVEIKKKKLAP